MAKVEPFQSSLSWWDMHFHDSTRVGMNEMLLWMENPALNYNSAVSKDYGNVSLAYFCSWLLTSSIVCLILSKIIPSISTTAFTALRVAGLLEPVKPIKMKTLGEHAKAIQKDPGSQKKKKKPKVTEWTTALPCRPWQCSTTFPSCPYLHIFFAAVLLVKKGVSVKERNSKTKEITMRETMQ